MPPSSFRRVYFTDATNLVIEAEIWYALKHEYALTAIDILARRTRLSFLNARAALDALPRVIDIMSTELNWSRRERNKQIRDAVEFLVGSMGLDEGYVTGDIMRRVKERVQPRGLLEHTERIWWDICGMIGRGLGNAGGGGRSVSTTTSTIGERARVLGRARFEVGEVRVLKTIFDKHADVPPISTTPDQIDNKGRISNTRILDVVKDVAGYEAITHKELEYVLAEAGFNEREALDWEEFLEVCGGLKEVTVLPAKARVGGRKARERTVIPVEKSGGGV
jgi:glycerol-3-phosphate dehydrogenase